MSKRLQVVFDDAEYRDMQRAARRRGVTVSQYVRDALRAARRAEPTGEPGRKLAAVREGARCAWPAPDIDRMLAEIERGYLGGATE